MLGSIQTTVLLGTKSFADWKLISISLVLPLCLIVALRRILFNEGRRKAMKERETPSKKNKKKKKRFQTCYDFTSILGWETDTMTNSGPISLTVAEALGFITQETTPAQYQSEPNSEPGPNNQITIGEALGLLGRSGDKKYRKWMVSMRRAVARLACGDPTAGDDRSRGGKPLIARPRKVKRVEREETVCHVCSRRSKNATLVPCEHAYCRVCSREIWINTRSCPICKTQIVEVLDTL